MREINEVQELNLQLMELSSFNDFNGRRVASDLRANTDLWVAAFIDREAYSRPIDQIRLRDIPAGYWNVDCLLVSVPRIHVEEFLAMARKWGPDELTELPNEEGSGPSSPVFRLWWD